VRLTDCGSDFHYSTSMTAMRPRPLALFAGSCLLALPAGGASAQSGAPVPSSDAEILAMIKARVDINRKGSGMVVGLIDPHGSHLPAGVRTPRFKGKPITLRKLSARASGDSDASSNFGIGLPAHILALRAGSDYETLVRGRIAKPLGMDNTAITLDAHMRRRLATGDGMPGKAA
jgi:hypothetical protein